MQRKNREIGKSLYVGCGMPTFAKASVDDASIECGYYSDEIFLVSRQLSGQAMKLSWRILHGRLFFYRMKKMNKLFGYAVR